MSYINQVNKDIAFSDTINNSVVDFGQRAVGRIIEVEDAVITGTGTVNINVFQVTGTIRVLNTWAQITEVTTLTNLTNMYADVYDGTNTIDLTKNTGASLSGASVGTFFTKDKASTETYSIALNDQVRVLEQTNKISVPFYITQKVATDTYIRFNFTTTDDPVSFKMTVWFEYLPINGGTLTLV